MATRTSAQSGNFSAGSTWVGGVAPVDADSFVIATGHLVTYDVATPVTTGFDDSDVYGVLQSLSGSSTVLRMNGRLRVRTNGTYHARSGHTLQFRGVAAASHILYAYPETGASVIMEGSDGMPCTTLAAGANEYSTSFSFTSASNFAVGEWFAIYNNTTAYTGNAGAATLRDEGFWVHDISGSTVYFRQFVGPTATITSYVGANLYVSNAKVFRVGQKVIFGTGANRNIATITAIDFNANMMTLSASVTGSVAGETIYETGSDKIHASGDKVRKIATVTTATSISTATTITVANANMFTAGDDIWIEARSECGGPSDYSYTAYGNETPGPRYKHTISSVSGNTLTLTGQIGYNVVLGALVNRLTRDVVVEPITPNTDYYGVYFDVGGTNYTRAIILKDVYFKYAGSSFGQAEGGIYIREGNWKANVNLAVTLNNTVPALSQQAWYEGVVMTGSNSTRDWGGFWFRGRYDQLRCCHVQGRFNSSYGAYYREGQAIYNSIAVGSDSWGFRYEGTTEWGELAYLYASRNYRSGRHQQYDGNIGCHHIIGDATEYSFHFVSNYYRGWYKHKHTGTRRGPQADAGPSGGLMYSIHTYVTAYDYKTAFQGRYQYHAGHIDRGPNGTYWFSVEHNMEYDALQQMVYTAVRDWDSAEVAWRVYNANDNSDYGVGWFETVYVPAGVSVLAKAMVKLAPSFSGNYPRFEARDVTSAVGVNQLGNATGNWGSKLSGGSTVSQFTAAAASAYETRTLSVAAAPYARYINIGVHADSSNQSEGWWLKDIVVLLDQPYVISRFNAINAEMSSQARVGVGASLTDTTIRLGGRIG